MHRDKRLGLALGILLLGVVGAFFFRNDSRPASHLPELEDPEKLDEQIAENDLVPYLDGSDDDAMSARKVSQSQSPTVASENDPWDLPAFLQQESHPGLPAADGPPSPIDTHVSVADGIPIPRENAAWEPVQKLPGQRQSARPDSMPVSTKKVSPKSVDGFIIHRVQPGDTLSELAERYLGSSARFREIYEANRETLRSPDDLRLGMSLRIPDPHAKRQESDGRADRIDARPISIRHDIPPANSSPAAVAPVESPPVDPSVKRRFVPVRRSPLIPRGRGTRTSQIEIPLDEVPRRLTQLPPRSGPLAQQTAASN